MLKLTSFHLIKRNISVATIQQQQSHFEQINKYKFWFELDIFFYKGELKQIWFNFKCQGLHLKRNIQYNYVNFPNSIYCQFEEVWKDKEKQPISTANKCKHRPVNVIFCLVGPDFTRITSRNTRFYFRKNYSVCVTLLIWNTCTCSCK